VRRTLGVFLKEPRAHVERAGPDLLQDRLVAPCEAAPEAKGVTASESRLLERLDDVECDSASRQRSDRDGRRQVSFRP
jgi:hypothetical protein